MSAYCMYTVLNFHWTPSQFLNLKNREKAFVIACIDLKINEEEMQLKRLKNG